MGEQLTAALFWLILLIPIGVFARQIRRVRQGTRRRFKGGVLFFFYSILPVLIYSLVFLVLVGVEEVTGHSLIAEGVARTLLLVVGIGAAEVLVLTGIFAVAVRFLRVPGNAA